MRTPSFWYRDDLPWERALLSPLAVGAMVFRAASALRRAAYRAGIFETCSAGAPVISVGNLVAGGAGKTPVVIHLAERLHTAGVRVGVVSRGFGGHARGPLDVQAETAWRLCGDEALLLARRLPFAHVVVGRDRVAAARRAVQRGAEVVLVDDGFSHLRLHRDLDLVVLDDERPFGNGRLLPRGPLRELPQALHRAGLLWRTSARPGDGVRSRLRVVQPEMIRGRRLVALAGIARPESFRRTLVEAGARVESLVEKGDHAPFSDAALRAVLRTSERTHADAVAVTEKDAMRLPAWCGAEAFVVVRVEVELLAGAELLDEALARVLGPKAVDNSVRQYTD